MAKYFLPSIIFLFSSILALPTMPALAVYDNVRFPTAQNLYLPEIGITLVVSADSKVATLAVYGSYIIITGSYDGATTYSTITLTSPQRQVFSNNWGLSTTCGDTSSSFTVSWGAASPPSITITPTGTCSPGGGGGPPIQIVTPDLPTTFTGTVTATASAGGKTTLTTPEGTKITVELPPGAVTTDTTITVTSVPVATVITAAAAAPAGKTIVSAFQLSATSAGLAVTSFAKTVTLTVTYTDSQITGLDEVSLKVYRWTGTQWLVLSTTVNVVTNTLTATTTAFSYFAIMGEAAPVVVTPPTKPIAEMTIAELKAEIARIAALIAQLQVELAKLIAVPQAFTTDLYYGLRLNNDVKRLQQFLIDKGYLKVKATGNYLSMTVAAVKAYQIAKSITPVNGRCGPKTRAAINADLGLSQ
jgi:hypothetical protein